MDSTIRESDGAARLRLVDVRFGAGQTSLHFGGGLAGVLTEPAERSAAALRIVTTVMGPRPDDLDGSVAVDGHLVSMHSLPAVLLPPSAPAVLNRDDLSGYWHALCRRRRDELAAAHASRRHDQHRIEAALDRARGLSGNYPATRDAAVAADSAPAVPEPEPEIELPSEVIRLHNHVRALLDAIDALVPEPDPEAMALADAWEAHTELAIARSRVDQTDKDNVAAVEARVAVARKALDAAPGAISERTRSEIDRRHRLVVEAEAKLFEARRRGRAQAVLRYEQAVAVENEALADAGVGSYASFLVALAGGGKPLDPAVRQAALDELDAANAELEFARRGGVGISDGEFQERSIELRAAADRLLARAVVGGDPPAELRALRIDPPARADRLRELAHVLDYGGIDAGDDPLAAARELVAPDPPVVAPAPGPDAQVWSAVPPGPGRPGEVARLEEQLADNRFALAELNGEIARLDALHGVGVAAIAPSDLAGVMQMLLDAYRAGNLLGGQLPIVLDGALDGLRPDAREAAVLALVEATDVQSIVVTDDLQVMKSVTDVGGTIVLWPES